MMLMAMRLVVVPRSLLQLAIAWGKWRVEMATYSSRFIAIYAWSKCCTAKLAWSCHSFSGGRRSFRDDGQCKGALQWPENVS